MSTETELEKLHVRLKGNGDLVQVADGVEKLLAHYEEKSGYLEYASKEIAADKDLCYRITSRITQTKGAAGMSVDPSGKKITNFGIKGEVRPDLKKLPPKPKLGPLGDAAYATAKWYHDNDPAQFKIRYRCILDENGDFILKHARRVVVETIDQRDREGTDLGKTPEGAKSFTTGPVSRVGDVYENTRAIIAYRETHPGPNGEPPLTFTPQEVVGGFQPDQDMQDVAGPEDET